MQCKNYRSHDYYWTGPGVCLKKNNNTTTCKCSVVIDDNKTFCLAGKFRVYWLEAISVHSISEESKRILNSMDF